MSSSSEKNSPSSPFDWEDDDEVQPSGKSITTTATTMGGHVLQESDMTPLTEGSTSEEDTGWLGGIGADFRNIAISLRGVVPPTIGAIGDIANFVQRSALSVAAEIAQLERDSDDEAGDSDGWLRLPWEIRTDCDSSAASDLECQEDEELKAKILAISVDHATFLQPFSVKGSSRFSEEDESKFIVLDEPRIHLIRRLLEIDENLAATHAHLSGRSDVKETVFWTNYFFNCEKVRREHLQDVQSMSLISALSTPADDIPPTKTAAAVSGADCDDENASQSSQNSLVPADDSSGSQAADTSGKDDGNDDDSSYIQVNSRSGIASPPCSLKSVEDLVLVNKSFAGGNNK